MESVHTNRIREVNRAGVSGKGDHVLYWMIGFRRLRYNHALQRAVGWARQLRRPLVILEPLRCDYPWASERLHAFILEGMDDNARRLARRNVCYHPYVEPEPGAGKGLLESVAKRACVVVTDDVPAFFLPRMVQAAGDRLPVKLEAVDSNGLVPIRLAEKTFATAHHFRRFVHDNLPWLLERARSRRQTPRPDPLARVRLPRLPSLPAEVVRRWPRASARILAADPAAVARLPVDHGVPRVETRGGAAAARRVLDRFLNERLHGYAARSKHPDHDQTSGLSAHLHFGHISAQEVFDRLAAHEGWDPQRVDPARAGKREGFWGLSADAEAFVDQLITWREIGLNMSSRERDADRYDSLPPWARKTLELHADDPRSHLYGLDVFADAATHDPVWNAAQRQLLREGRIHGYLRMLWGKNILAWSQSPARALEIMTELNSRLALDGRDPNSTSGIFWTLGRYDRAWGPARPVFGTVRYMTSDSARKKLKMKNYLERFQPGSTVV